MKWYEEGKWEEEGELVQGTAREEGITEGKMEGNKRIIREKEGMRGGEKIC